MAQVRGRKKSARPERAPWERRVKVRGTGPRWPGKGLAITLSAMRLTKLVESMSLGEVWDGSGPLCSFVENGPHVQERLTLVQEKVVALTR